MAKEMTKPAGPETAAAEEVIQAAREAAQSAPEAEEVSQDLPAEDDTQKDQEAACEGLGEFYVTPQGGLNLRAGPSLTEPLLAVLPHGAGVRPDGRLAGDGQWARVRTGLLAGWVKAEYLARMPVETHGAE